MSRIMDEDYIGKHEKINLLQIPSALLGACFHGEVWVKCPKCKIGYEVVGSEPLAVRNGYRIYRCVCGQMFKDM